MKTLDEVIDDLERGLFVQESALHYLKEYRDKAHNLDIDIAEHHRTFEQLGIEIAWYQKAKAEMEEISADYVALKQWWAEQQENPPLTWDELKTLKGKPVWVEYENYVSDWEIIENVGTFKWADSLFVETNRSILHKEDQDKTWQAYRKERE